MAALRSDKVWLIRSFLRPGLGLKRWLLLCVLGVGCIGLGIGFAIATPISPRLLAIGQTLTLKFLPPLWRGSVFIAIGCVLVTIALVRIYHIVEGKLRRRREGVSLIEALHTDAVLSRGPRVVAIGGGTGLSTLLRGLKQYTAHITAIVTVADDGGSSGRLRAELGIPPPGDARNCLIALSEAEPVMERLMGYRFQKGESLAGHSLGNLLLAALIQMEGSLEKALESASSLLAVRGRVVPVSERPDLVLKAETEDGEIFTGESHLGHTGKRIKRVWLEPRDAPPSPLALRAIAQADLIVIGPGSLFTSLIPNFLVQGITDAVNAARAPKVLVCNVATQPGETDGFSVADHLQVFQGHTGVQVTHLLVNDNVRPLPPQWHQEAVRPEKPPGFSGVYIEADVVDEALRTRHDPHKLARCLIGLVSADKRITSVAAVPSAVGPQA
ncbi:MAG: YvcK family protein [Dehalococcoidia bacterium]|nr:YvcK family protein [Dehalococcoidia bacterium]MDW8119330.1 YvcK family protein [Chloroflexota bacterium]